MERKDATAVLAELIREKERHRDAEASELKAHFNLTYERLRPVNIIKNTLSEVISDPGLKRSALDTAIGLVSGMAAKRLLVGKTKNPFIKLLGAFAEIGVSGLAAKNGADIRSAASLIFEKINSAFNPGKPK